MTHFKSAKIALYNNFIFRFFSKSSAHFMTTCSMHSNDVYCRSFVLAVCEEMRVDLRLYEN